MIALDFICFQQMLCLQFEYSLPQLLIPSRIRHMMDSNSDPNAPTLEENSASSNLLSRS